jgi:hypothetical protein
MKRVIFLTALGFSFFIGMSWAFAQPSAAVVKSGKSKDVSFDEVLVQGKYQFADESVTTVEQDKVLDGLLGVRLDFKDRIKQSASRH